VSTDSPAPLGGVLSRLWARSPLLRRLTKLFSGTLAVIGVVSAIIGYATSGTNFFLRVDDYLRGRSETRDLIAAADERLRYSDYEEAWRANTKARQLSPRSEEAAVQQARIAMKWLEDVRLSSAAGPQTFSQVVDPLKSALVERLAETRGRDRADIHAHIGWANFLRYRDGLKATGVAEEFDEALREDPENMYGHLMRGFWILWNGRPIDDARADLELALRSDVDPAFADGMVMSALINITTDEYMAGAIEFANQIRKTGRNIENDDKRRVLWYYSISLDSPELLNGISKIASAQDHVLTLAWLKKADLSLFDQRVVTYFTAYFLELDSKTEEASRLYAELVQPSRNGEDRLTGFARARLTKMKR
jgi:hypothetical protein